MPITLRSDGDFQETTSGGLAGQQVASYTDLTALATPTVATLVQVTTDSDKAESNTLYWLLPNGARRYLASTNDKYVDYSTTGVMIHDGGGAFANNANNTADKVFDGNPNTYYYAGSSGAVYVGRDLGTSRLVNQFVLLAQQDDSQYATALNGAQIQYSNDSSNWTTVFTVSGMSTSNYKQALTCSFPANNGRYWRLYWGNFGHLATLQILQSRA